MHHMLQLIALILATVALAGCQSMFEAMPHKKWGFIDRTGALVIEPQFDDVLRDQYGGCMPLSHKVFKNFSEGLCAVRLGNKWGFIDRTGKFALPAKYDNAGTFSEGLALVRTGIKYGYIDKTGKEVIAVRFDFPAHASAARNDNPDWDFSQGLLERYEFSEGLAVAEKNGLFGFIDKTGQFVIEPEYAAANPFHQGIARVERLTDRQTPQQTIFIDRTGKTVLAAGRHGVDFAEEIFLATNAHYDRSRKMHYIRSDGTRLSKDEYDDARIFSEGLAAVAPRFTGSSPNNSAYGYIDKSGELVIKPSFDISGNNIAANFRDGRAIVSQTKIDVLGNYNHLDGIIDRQGNWVLQPKYSHISAYCDGLARAFSDQGTVYLDKNGRERIRAGTGWGNSFSEGLAAVMER